MQKRFCMLCNIWKRNFFPVMVSSALKLTLKMIVISVIVINLIYMLYAPYDEYFYAEERKNEKRLLNINL